MTSPSLSTNTSGLDPNKDASGRAHRSLRSHEHWVVHMNRRNRSLSFIAIFATVALCLLEGVYGLQWWLGASLQCLLYPQLIYLRSRRSERPFEAEYESTLIDALVFGLWTGLLGFPKVLSFMFLAGSVVNPGAFRGRSGFLQGVSLYIVGASVGISVVGFELSLEMSLRAELLAMSTLLGFLILFSLGAHQRLTKLQETRDLLKKREHDLNQKLQRISSLEVKLQELSIRDVQTGLYNRRYFEPSLQRELIRSEREQRPLCLLMIELYRYSSMSARYETQQLSELLNELASFLNHQVRGYDLLARFAEARFVLLMTETTQRVAEARAHQLRERWALYQGSQIQESQSQLIISIVSSQGAKRGESEDEARHLMSQVIDLLDYASQESSSGAQAPRGVYTLP